MAETVKDISIDELIGKPIEGGVCKTQESLLIALRGKDEEGDESLFSRLIGNAEGRKVVISFDDYLMNLVKLYSGYSMHPDLTVNNPPRLLYKNLLPSIERLRTADGQGIDLSNVEEFIQTVVNVAYCYTHGWGYSNSPLNELKKRCRKNSLQNLEAGIFPKTDIAQVNYYKSLGMSPRRSDPNFEGLIHHLEKLSLPHDISLLVLANEAELRQLREEELGGLLDMVAGLPSADMFEAELAKMLASENPTKA